MAELAPRRRQRLAVDLPAAALCGLAALAPGKGGRAFVSLQPLPDGRITAEAGTGAVVGLLEIAGAQLAQPLLLPSAALLQLRRRHPSAEVLAIDGPADGAPLLRLLALDATGTASVLTPEAEPAPGSVADLLADVPLLGLGGEQTAMLDPRLLDLALRAMRQIAPGPVDLALPAHDALGLLVRARPADGAPVVAATLAVARMLTLPD